MTQLKVRVKKSENRDVLIIVGNHLDYHSSLYVSSTNGPLFNKSLVVEPHHLEVLLKQFARLVHETIDDVIANEMTCYFNQASDDLICVAIGSGIRTRAMIWDVRDERTSHAFDRVEFENN
ncbi:hypothetical protein BGW80DRAFT_1513267 [Lactifluus volemus]|nr:hypothetical protein BGW80DRAFT_1513267 [Lactifluus volemus]